MEKGVTVLVIILFILVIAAFMGNIEIIAALIVQDTSLITGNGGLVFVAVIADIILLCLLIKKLSKPIANSLSLAKRGITNRLNIKKQSAEIKKTSRNITDSINRLKELRALGIERVSTIRTHNFCQFLVAVSNEEQMKVCLEAVNRRKAIVNEIGDIEQSIVQLADQYRAVGDAEKCVQYLEIVESVHNRNDFGEIKKECNEQLILREKESKAVKLWSTILIASILIFSVLITTSAIKSYNENIPYDNFKRDIENQTLIKDMFSYDLRGENNSYYEVANTEKDKNIIIDYLSDYKACDDIQSALWLLYTTGKDDIMEKSFNRWIIKYGESNGEKSTNQEGKDDYWYAIYYEVDEYVIITSSVGMYEHLSVTKWNRTTQ